MTIGDDSASTAVRLVRIKPFENLDDLPEPPPTPVDRDDSAAIDELPSANATVPLPAERERLPDRFFDTGPLDMTLDGSKRLVVLSAGVQLIVRTTAKGAVLKVIPEFDEDYPAKVISELPSDTVMEK